MEQYKNIIFDVDGVLLDTMSIWENSANFYLKEAWNIDAPEELDRVCAVMSLLEAGSYIKEQYPQIPLDAAGIADGVVEFIRERYVKAPATKHMVETIRELKRRGCHLFLATASDEENVKGALTGHGVWGCFDAIYTCTEIGYSKNYVEYYECIAERIGTSCQGLVMVEDSIHSVLTAKKAGLTVIGVYEQAAADKWKQMQEHCDVCVGNLAELLPFV
ncbi:MAG: HAD family hydrolase [Clostridium sp.]|nr:HAD family hydrolase [Clostridium sp.]